MWIFKLLQYMALYVHTYVRTFVGCVEKIIARLKTVAKGENFLTRIWTSSAGSATLGDTS